VGNAAFWTMAVTLDRLTPHLPPALVTNEDRERLRGICARLPAALSNWVYLECRLAAGTTPVDLAVNVDHRGRDILAGDYPATTLDNELTSHPAWVRIRALARRWADTGTDLHDAVESLWLEFDAPKVEEGVPVPGVFVDFDHTFLEGMATAAAAPLIVESVAPLLGAAIHASTQRNIRRCIANLSENARVIYVGVMLSRAAADDTVRLCVVGLLRHQLLPYLHSVGWEGEAVTLTDLTTMLASADAAAAEVTIVHLDIDRVGVRPSVGLEYPFARRSQLLGSVSETRLLDCLVERGLCAPSKRDALAQWPGHEFATMAHELWPSLLARRINHVKLVCGGPRPVEAKAYLCFNHEFYRRASRVANATGGNAGSTALSSRPPARMKRTAPVP